MMVRMLDSVCGTVWPDRAFVHLRKGEVHEVPNPVGQKWLAIGLAALVPVVVAVDTMDAPRATKKRDSRATKE